MKVTGFSWHSGGCWCQKETRDSFNSWGEGITAAGGAARRWQREGGATTLTPTPLLPGAAGRQRGSAGEKDTIFADPRSSAGRDPRCPLPMLLNVMPNWHIRPWGWGWGRRLSKEMGVMSESNPSASSSESWSFPKNLDGAGSLACVNYTVLCVCAQPARMYILGEKPILVAHLVIPLSGSLLPRGNTQPVLMASAHSGFTLGASGDRLVQTPALGLRSQGSRITVTPVVWDLERWLFCPGAPKPLPVSPHRLPACPPTVLRVSSIPPSSSHCPLCTNHLGKTQWSDPNFRKPPRGHN